MSTFDQLKIDKIVQETEDTISIHLEIPESLKDKYSFKAGQYLTVRAQIKGEDIRRAYSICTPPHAIKPAITIKRVKGGRMSNYLHDHVKAGEILDVMPPDGRFVVKTQPQLARDHYFLAAGSGITPIMSMIEDILEQEPKSTCYLLYGSRSEQAIIFDKHIASLLKYHEGQLYVMHTISQPTRKKAKGLSGLLGKKTTEWSGEIGRVDADKLDIFLDKYKGHNNDKLYYICGPGNMIDRMQLMLREKGVSKDQVKIESFGGSNSSESSASKGNGAPVSNAKLIINSGNDTFELVSDGEKYILDTILDAGKEAPYSCTSGACSTCMAKVIQGSTIMDACYALDDDEVAEGYILTCQAKPTSAVVELDLEV